MGTNGLLMGHCANRYPTQASSDVVLLPATLPGDAAKNATFLVVKVADPPPTPPPPNPPPPPPHVVRSIVTVNTSANVATITPHMTGCGLEDINHELNGGLYSQMVLDESFETTTNASLRNRSLAGGHADNPTNAGLEPTSSWRASTTASVPPAPGSVRIVSHPPCFNGPHCLEMLPGTGVTQSGQ
jgi:hypothetical protein